jgi:hypothetical protein
MVLIFNTLTIHSFLPRCDFYCQPNVKEPGTLDASREAGLLGEPGRAAAPCGQPRDRVGSRRATARPPGGPAAPEPHISRRMQ